MPGQTRLPQASSTWSPSSRPFPRSSSSTSRYWPGGSTCSVQAPTHGCCGAVSLKWSPRWRVSAAVVLFPTLKRHHEGAALGFVAARVLEAALIVTGIVSLLSVVSLRDASATGPHADSLVTAARALVAVHDWTFLLGPGLMPGVNALLLGSVLYRSALVPRIIPAMGLVGAPLILVAGAATLVGVNEQVSLWTAIATLPIFAWELSLGLWLTAKGFTPAASTPR